MSRENTPVGERLMGQGLVVAIDGPSGAGKSTVARAIAAEIGAHYLDTGAMYRALAWWIAEKGVDPTDAPGVLTAARDWDVRIETTPHAPRFLVGDVDVTQQIRGEAVTNIVSEVAAHPGVRALLIEMQRDHIAQARESGKGIVAEGRDITTVVAPDADLRLLITASAKERERRRTAEAGEATAKTMGTRDARDSQVNDFTTPAPGVELIDTTDMPLRDVIATVMRLLESTSGQ